MMEQDPAFFAAEANSSAALTACLISHTQQLETLLSKTIGSILIVSVNVVSSCVLSIAIAWKLGLVAVFGAFPLICLAGYLQVSLSSNRQSWNAHYYDEVLRFASECVAYSRTVSSLAMEVEVRSKFETKLKAPYEGISGYTHQYVTFRFIRERESSRLVSKLRFVVSDTKPQYQDLHSAFGMAVDS